MNLIKVFIINQKGSELQSSSGLVSKGWGKTETYLIKSVPGLGPLSDGGAPVIFTSFPPAPALVRMPITEKTSEHQKIHNIYYRFIKKRFQLCSNKLSKISKSNKYVIW
jgi:hypothetical protein